MLYGKSNMKILHMAISDHYTEGMTYQDNMLIRQNLLDGHEVTIITDNYMYVNGEIVKGKEEDYIYTPGLRVIRKAYHPYLNETISSKICRIDGLYELIDSIDPDVILYHSVYGQPMKVMAAYLKMHPQTRAFIDCHESLYNSGSGHGKIANYLFYRVFQKHYLKYVMPYTHKILSVSYNSTEFLKKMYGIPDEQIEFYPLGGVVMSLEEREQYREARRNELALNPEDILLVHSGKLEPTKRTEELLDAFYDVKSNGIRMIIIGSIPADMHDILMPKIQRDNRVQYLGWKSGNELQEYICAGDLYIQPGLGSATLQNAACCGTAVAVYPHLGYTPVFGEENVFYIKTKEDIVSLLNRILEDRSYLEAMREKTYSVAKNVLDYRVLAARLYQ